MPERSRGLTEPLRSADGGTTTPGVIWQEGTAQAPAQGRRKPDVRRLRSPKGRQMKESATGGRAFRAEPGLVVSGRWSCLHSRPELFEVWVVVQLGERSRWASEDSCRNPVFHTAAWRRKRPRLCSARASMGFRDAGKEGSVRMELWGDGAGERHETRAMGEGNWGTERPADDSSCPEMEWNDWLLRFL